MDVADRDIHWSNQLEDLIAQEGEKCRGLAWIHQRAEHEAGRKNNYIMLPVIILSTLSGTASVGSSAIFGDTSVSSIVIGLVSISVGILNTVNSYFAYAKRSEAHRIAYLHYSKLFTWVSVELSLPRNERINAEDMLKQLRSEMERLAETTPSPPPHILTLFSQTFKTYTNVSKPAETNGLAKIMVFRELKSAPSTASIASAAGTFANPLAAAAVRAIESKAGEVQAYIANPMLSKPPQSSESSSMTSSSPRPHIEVDLLPKDPAIVAAAASGPIP
jgi:hypothetical protein